MTACKSPRKERAVLAQLHHPVLEIAKATVMQEAIE